jgi:hypothetical protein
VFLQLSSVEDGNQVFVAAVSIPQSVLLPLRHRNDERISTITSRLGRVNFANSLADALSEGMLVDD